MEFLESEYLYLWLMLFSASYPLAQSFEWRLRYYTKWKRLARGTLAMIVIFIPWDVAFTKAGVWWFHPNYTLGVDILGLPVEEWLFFIIVPFACIFIYEVMNFYVKKDILYPYARSVFVVIIMICVVLSSVYYDKLYTFYTCIGTAVGLGILVYANPKWIGRFLLMYLVCWLPFLLINGALTGAFTASPVVNYNPEEFMGLRIFTIPIEDSIYNLLMLLIVVSVYEYKNKRSEKGMPKT